MRSSCDSLRHPCTTLNAHTWDTWDTPPRSGQLLLRAQVTPLRAWVKFPFDDRPPGGPGGARSASVGPRRPAGPRLASSAGREHPCSGHRRQLLRAPTPWRSAENLLSRLAPGAANSKLCGSSPEAGTDGGQTHGVQGVAVMAFPMAAWSRKSPTACCWLAAASAAATTPTRRTASSASPWRSAPQQVPPQPSPFNGELRPQRSTSGRCRSCWRDGGHERQVSAGEPAHRPAGSIHSKMPSVGPGGVVLPPRPSAWWNRRRNRTTG